MNKLLTIGAIGLGVWWLLSRKSEDIEIIIEETPDRRLPSTRRGELELRETKPLSEPAKTLNYGN